MGMTGCSTANDGGGAIGEADFGKHVMKFSEGGDKVVCENCGKIHSRAPPSGTTVFAIRLLS